MKLRLVAIEASCRSEMAAGKCVPSENLRTLANTAGLCSKTLDALFDEAKRKLEAELAEVFS